MSDTPARTTATREELDTLLRHRQIGAALVSGAGLEIGACHYPLPLPTDASVAYLDIDDADATRAAFPELHADELVAPHWLADISQLSVPAITGRRFDFVVLSHVLEHVANPIQAIANVWAGIVADGLLVIAVPDKRFTFDNQRPLTPFSHLLGEYEGGVTEVDDAHYLEFLRSAAPSAFDDDARLSRALRDAARRREHAHVWDSDSFRELWHACVPLLRLDAHVVFESTADDNRFEYFAVIRRTVCAEVREIDAMRILAAVHRTRADLRAALPSTAASHQRDLLLWATTAGATIDSDARGLEPFQEHYRRLLGQRPHVSDDRLPTWGEPR